MAVQVLRFLEVLTAGLQPNRAAQDHFPALTGVRFPLAIWVIVHHLTGPGAMLDSVVSGLPSPAQTFIRLAYVALGTFFVLSGFVLARSYRFTEWTGENLLRYTAARIARFYPVYLLSLLVIAPFMYRDLAGAPGLGGAAGRAGLFFNYLFVLQGWDKLPVSWNTPAWSLSCELFFYACFPLVILLVRGYSWPRVISTVALAFALPMGVRLMGTPQEWKPFLFFGDFLIGVALAGLYEKAALSRIRFIGRGQWVYVPAAALGVLMILSEPWVQSWALTDAGLRVANAALVLGMAFGGGFIARALSTRAVVLEGKATYAIYILHVPLLWWYKRSYVYHALPGPAAAVVFIAAVVILSTAVCVLIEEPANRAIREKAAAWLRANRRRAPKTLPARRATSEAA
jgi:peptidoglycan/LPS O-acetylase OafA/YrhL